MYKWEYDFKCTIQFHDARLHVRNCTLALAPLTGDCNEKVISPLDPLSKSTAWNVYIMLPTCLVCTEWNENKIVSLDTLCTPTGHDRVPTSIMQMHVCINLSYVLWWLRQIADYYYYYSHNHTEHTHFKYRNGAGWRIEEHGGVIIGICYTDEHRYNTCIA